MQTLAFSLLVRYFPTEGHACRNEGEVPEYYRKFGQTAKDICESLDLRVRVYVRDIPQMSTSMHHHLYLIFKEKPKVAEVRMHLYPYDEDH
jgi:hypothetical protein